MSKPNYNLVPPWLYETSWWENWWSTIPVHSHLSTFENYLALGKIDVFCKYKRIYNIALPPEVQPVYHVSIE